MLLGAALVGRGADGATGWNGPRAQLGIAGLVAAAGWLLPAGATRGASVTALLILALLEALAEWLWQSDEGKGGDARLSLFRFLPLALTVQALTQGGLLLQLGRGELPWGSLVGWPLLGAAALALLAQQTSALTALTAGGASIALGGGWTAESALALAAVAAGTLAAEHLGPRSPETQVLGWGHLSPAVAVALGIAGVAWKGWIGATEAAFLAGILAIPPLLRHSPRGVLAGLSALAAASTFGPHDDVWHWRVQSPNWGEILRQGLLLPALFPGLPVRSFLGFATALLLAFLEARLTGTPPLVACTLGASFLRQAEGEAKGVLQTFWTATWVAGGLFAAAYPWLRPEPHEEILTAVALDGAASRLLLPIAFVLLIWILERRRNRSPVLAGTFVLLLVCIGSLAAREPAPPPILEGQAQTLTVERFRWTEPADELPARRLVIDSSLAFSLDLETGRPVATVRLHHPDGSVTNRILRAGVQTSEWAAQRPDVAAALQAPPPPAWTSFVAPGPFFASRFRGTWPLDGTKPVSRISVLRHPKLPPEVTLTLFRVELRP